MPKHLFRQPEEHTLSVFPLLVWFRLGRVRKAAWKKPIDFSGPGWIWNLQISTNTRQLPLLGGKYTSDNEPCEVAGFDLPVKGIMVVSGRTVETSYKVTELIDANVTMEKVKGELDVEIHNTNSIENLKFVIEMSTGTLPRP